MFKKPLITLNLSISDSCLQIYSPSSFPITSGDFRADFTKGKVTIVKSPSNSFFVFLEDK